MALAVLLGLAAPTAMAAPATPDSAPMRLAADLEHRAERTSFADLERFGEAAAHNTDRESLARLQHVVRVFTNQSEFDKAGRWNAILQRNAQRAGDRRYAELARINALQSRYERGDGSAAAAIERLAGGEPDWFVRVDAMSAQALVMTDEDQAGPALKLLSQAEDLIPAGDPASDAAESTVWETLGIALMVLDDLDGSAAAFRRADFQFANPAYPRPDFDDIYNMAHMAAQFGDAPLARALAAAHHRLARRSDLPHLRIWDQNLCAIVADSFGQPGQVLNCLRGLDQRLTGAGFIAQDALPLRAIARARLGDVAGAEADLAQMKILTASKDMPVSILEREPQVEAEILLAEGKDRQAFGMLRAYDLAQAQSAARRFDVGVHQLTGSLESQLAMARRDAALQRQAARAQQWIVLIGALFLVCGGAVLIWQRQVTGRLRAAQLRAEMASRAKSEFLANMSHEIRTPLNGVVGVADLLAEAGLPPREREMAEIIRSSGQSLERLLSDVLDLARVEAGRMTIEPAPFHAGDLVRSVAGLSRMRADEKGLRLDAHVAPQLEAWFVGDATRVRQILTNLVSNAVKFTDAGSVAISAQPVLGGGIRFAVADTGVGFDAAVKDRLFGRFQQADGSITRRFGGTGLGLAISRELAGLMGGTLDCDSEPGRGSRFWFEAPFAPAAAPSAPVEDRAATPTCEARAVRVLVVDDHATNRTVVRMMLEPLGVEADCAENGEAAVEAVARGVYDLVFMDMQMPVMDGLEATRVIREQERASGRPRTPVIMLSANALPEHCEASLEAGADGHVPKPVTLGALVAALNAVLRDDAAAPEARAVA